MTIEERADMAVALKRSRCNCTQAVLVACKDEMGLDEDTLMSLGSGFGAGMGCLEATCGALVGATMVAGVKKSGKGSMQASRVLLRRFEEECGKTICKDLKQHGTDCSDCVKNAVLLLKEVFPEL
ncbi:MAG: C-GCAxxG-C-C family protein [Sphaerochaetaceae bacterium]|nr:C-GCAxxG-C-C family protein [Sphaerochaetaceae bacterium]